MIRAYDKLYLEDAMRNLAVALDYGAMSCAGGIGEFYDRMLAGRVILILRTEIRDFLWECPALIWPKVLLKVPADVLTGSTMCLKIVLLFFGPAGYLLIFNGLRECHLKH